MAVKVVTNPCSKIKNRAIRARASLKARTEAPPWSESFWRFDCRTAPGRSGGLSVDGRRIETCSSGDGEHRKPQDFVHQRIATKGPEEIQILPPVRLPTRHGRFIYII